MNEELKLLRLLKAMCEPLAEGVMPFVRVHGEGLVLSLGVVFSGVKRHVPVLAEFLLKADDQAAENLVYDMRQVLIAEIRRAMR